MSHLFKSLPAERQADVHRWATLYILFPEKWCGEENSDPNDIQIGRDAAASIKRWIDADESVLDDKEMWNESSATARYLRIQSWAKEDGLET